MEKLICVPELIKRYPELGEIGYSEELIEDLVTNGELLGEYDSLTGELKVDPAFAEDLIKICWAHFDEHQPGDKEE